MPLRYTTTTPWTKPCNQAKSWKCRRKRRPSGPGWFFNLKEGITYEGNVFEYRSGKVVTSAITRRSKYDEQGCSQARPHRGETRTRSCGLLCDQRRHVVSAHA